VDGGDTRIGFKGKCTLPGESVTKKYNTATPMNDTSDANPAVSLQVRSVHLSSKEERGIASNDPHREAMDVM
jgi:hypothetical protein